MSYKRLKIDFADLKDMLTSTRRITNLGENTIDMSSIKIQAYKSRVVVLIMDDQPFRPGKTESVIAEVG